MKYLKTIALAILVGASLATAKAGTITFEDMPDAYLFYGGQTNFGTYWDGIYFGPSSTILDVVRGGYNSAGYPPHSGTSVLFSISIPYIDAIFDNPVNYVSFWYSAPQPFSVSWFDSADNLIGSQTLPSVYGSNAFIDFSTAGNDIKKVTFAGTGNYFTIDDFTAPFITGKPRDDTPHGVPDAGGSLGLLGLGLLGVAALRRGVRGQR